MCGDFESAAHHGERGAALGQRGARNDECVLHEGRSQQSSPHRSIISLERDQRPGIEDGRAHLPRRPRRSCLAISSSCSVIFPCSASQALITPSISRAFNSLRASSASQAEVPLFPSGAFDLLGQSRVQRNSNARYGHTAILLMAVWADKAIQPNARLTERALPTA